MDIRSLWARAGNFFVSARSNAGLLWARYRALRLWQQAVIALVALGALWGIFSLLTGGPAIEAANKSRSVVLKSVGELSGGESGGDFIGTVRSVTEANILAQSGGTVRAVHTTLGSSVPAGFIIAEIDNASERASVLQAEGAYEAALAARTIAQRQNQNTTLSLSEAETSVRNLFRSSYTTLDATLHTYIDTFFGSPTAIGPALLINSPPGPNDALPRARAAISNDMHDWGRALSSSQGSDAEALLADAEKNTRSISNILIELARATNQRTSNATSDQLAALATARTTVDAQLTAISAARSAYRAAATAAAVGQTQTNPAAGSADAVVKQALGALRGAQANFEKTVVRAPLSGTVNFLPLRVGDYVTAFSHVATVAQNGSLEVVTYVSQADRDLLTVGSRVSLGQGSGTITSVAPALDPVRKQIEVRIAAAPNSTLVNGQSVHVGVVSVAPRALGPTTLPLAAVKLMTERRITFTVSDGRLVAQEVEVGDVHGDRIEITSPISVDLIIVTDARGLVEGEKVTPLQ